MKELAEKSCVITLIGNKSDLESERQVSYEKANEYAKDNGMMYFETSAITDSGIEDAFTKFIES